MGKDLVTGISEPCYKGAVLERNYRKMTMNSFVKFHDKKCGSHTIAVISKSVL